VSLVIQLHRSLEKQNLQGLPKAQATDQIPPRQGLSRWALPLLQSLFGSFTPPTLSQEPGAGRGTVARLLCRTQRGDLREEDFAWADTKGLPCAPGCCTLLHFFKAFLAVLSFCGLFP